MKRPRLTIERVKKLVDVLKRSRVGRTLARYSLARGALLAGGIAYSALFSLFAALTIAFTIFAAFLGENAELRSGVVQALDAWLPGVVSENADSGALIDVDSLINSSLLTWTGIIAGVVLLWSALGFMDSLRSAIVLVFGQVEDSTNAVKAKLTGLVGFVAFGAAVLGSAAVGVVSAAAGDWISSVIGFGGAALSGVLGFLVSLVLDTAVLVYLYRVLSHSRACVRDLLIGSLVAGLVMGILRLVSTRVVAGSANNPLLASVATLVTLLVWVNLMARVTLYAAAWISDPPIGGDLRDAGVSSPEDAEQGRRGSEAGERVEDVPRWRPPVALRRAGSLEP